MLKNIFLILFLFLSICSFSQDYHSDKIFVKFKQNTSLANIDYTSSQNLSTHVLTPLQRIFFNHKVKSVLKTSKIKDEVLQRTYTVSIADSTQLDHIILELKKLQEVELAEKIPVYKTFLTPNDLHPNQWHLTKINAQQAWDISTGKPTITVAIVDDAVKINHEDLQANIWTNPGEIANNGIDDDNNGYIDDVNGYDVADNDNNPNPPSFATNDIFTHGTHCAGIVSAASGNSKGIASIGYSVKIIPVKTKYSSTSDQSLQATYQGVEYAIAAGAKVISMSWGGGGYSYVMQDLFDYAHSQGIVLIAAAGNNGLNTSTFYPASYNHIISVGATDNTDHVASFSNYGTTTDIMAPGVYIWSTLAGSTSSYGYLSGTSMACPLVAGTAALLLSVNSSLPPEGIEDCLKSGATNINALNPSYVGLMGGGRLNANNAIRCATNNIYADFIADPLTVCTGMIVTVTDMSIGGPTAWNWSFPGANPTSSTVKNPLISYSTLGKYSIGLTASNGTVSGTTTKTDYITVYRPDATLSGNTSIQLGNTAYLKLDFTGIPPFNIYISDGNTISSQSNILSNPYYLPVLPTVTATYSISGFSDKNCAGTFTGSATITVTTITGTSPVCPTTDGLIAQYLLNGNALDASGNGNHATFMAVSGTEMYANDRLNVPNSCASLQQLSYTHSISQNQPGGNGYYQVNNTLGNFRLNDFSISAWINIPDTLTGSNMIVSKRQHDFWGNQIDLGVSYNRVYFDMSNGVSPYAPASGDSLAMFSSPILPNQWHNIVVTRKNNISYLYIDGILNSTSPYRPIDINNTYQFLIGASKPVTGVYYDLFGTFNGKLDDINVYDRALTECEIAKMYDCNNTCGSCISSTDLLADYPFNGNANDISNNNNNGTVVGATLTADRFGNPNSAYYFDGAGDHIVVANSASLQSYTTALGFSFWTKWDPIDNSGVNFGSNVFNKVYDGTGGGLLVDILNGTHPIGTFTNALRYSCSADNNTTGFDVHPYNDNVAVNQWQHNYVQFENNRVTFYINGAFYYSTPVSGTVLDVNTLNLYIGSNAVGLRNYKGALDDIKIFKRVLTAFEIQGIYNNQPLCTTSPIASYPFCGNPNDVSPNLLNGTISGSVSLQPDRFNIVNSSYSFAGGNNDVILIENKSNLLTLQNFSVSFWIKRSRTNTKEDLFLSTGSGGWGLYISNTSEGHNNQLGFTQVDLSGSYSPYTLNDLNWHHCAVVSTNSQTTFYLDGVNTGTQAYARTFTPSANYSIGARYGVGEAFEGQLDDFKIYNKVLTDAEVQDLYNESPPCNSSPIASYPFCGNANDVSGNGNNLSFTGLNGDTDPVPTTDRFGNPNSAYHFDINTKWLARTITGLSSSISVSLWFKASNLTVSGAYYPSLIDFYDRTYLNNFYTSFSMGHDIRPYIVGSSYNVNSEINVYYGPEQTNLSTPNNTFLPETWYHYVATYDTNSKAFKIYKDGALLASTTASANPKLITDLIIGSGHYRVFNTPEDYTTTRLSNYMSGEIDDIKIYDRVISQQEITNLYNAPAPCSSPCTLTIIGNSTGCLTQNSIYTAISSSASNINWTVTGGKFTKLSANTISVNWTSTGLNSIKAGETVCGLSSSITVNTNCCLGSVGISGNNIGCLKDTTGSYIYEIVGASSFNFQWAVRGGIFQQIAPNAISVIWTNRTVSGLVTASSSICGINKNFPVNVTCCNPSTAKIIGKTVICKDSTYTYYATNASVSDNYNWTVTGGTVTKLDNFTIKVKWNSVGVKSIRAYESQCNTSPNLLVTVSSCTIPIKTITGTNYSCNNSVLTYKVSSSDTSPYVWIVNGGSFTTESFGSNTITVTWTSIGQNFVNAIDISKGQTYAFPVTIVCCGNDDPSLLPHVTLDLAPIDMQCNTVGSIALQGGLPNGGSYWYNGNADNSLDISIPGSYPLIYQYTDPYLCTNTASGILNVKLCTLCETANPPCTCPGFTCPPRFKIYNTFSPNGDLINDFWVIDSLTGQAKVSILDKWGNEHYNNPNYLNNWNGTNNSGENLPVGIYYFTIEIEPGRRRFAGSVGIIR